MRCCIPVAWHHDFPPLACAVRIPKRTGAFMRTNGMIILGVAVFAALIVGVSAVPAQAGVTLAERTQSYKVSGRTGAELWRSISRRGPRENHPASATEMRMTIGNVRIAMRGNRCTVSGIDVQLAVVTRYPRWTGRRRAGRDLRDRWRQFSARIRRHEAKHITITREFASAVRREIRQAQRRGSDCSRAGRSLLQRIEALRRAHDRRQRQLDRREGGTSRLRSLRALLVRG